MRQKPFGVGALGMDSKQWAVMSGSFSLTHGPLLTPFFPSRHKTEGESQFPCHQHDSLQYLPPPAGGSPGGGEVWMLTHRPTSYVQSPPMGRTPALTGLPCTLALTLRWEQRAGDSGRPWRLGTLNALDPSDTGVFPWFALFPTASDLSAARIAIKTTRARGSFAVAATCPRRQFQVVVVGKCLRYRMMSPRAWNVVSGRYTRAWVKSSTAPINSIH